jgi:hypothetical protein
MFHPLYDFICNFDFQYIPKVAIMLPFFGIMNIMKLINIIVVVEWKSENKTTWVGIMHFKITCAKESQGFQNLGVIHGDSGWKTCDLWLTYNWFN